MRIEVNIILNDSCFPKDNKPIVLSIIKKALMADNITRYKELYEDGKTLLKSFCFALKLNNPTFINDEIRLSDKNILLTISTDDMLLEIDLYNAFLKIKKELFPLKNGNTMQITNVKMQNTESVNADKILIHMLSPLVLREHCLNNTIKDRYVGCDDDDFEEIFFNNTKHLLKKLKQIEIDQDDISITKVNAKKTVTVLFGQKITCNIGDFLISGNREILSILYQIGIGSKRSQGNGMFNIVKQG